MKVRVRYRVRVRFGVRLRVRIRVRVRVRTRVGFTFQSRIGQGIGLEYLTANDVSDAHEVIVNYIRQVIRWKP